MGMTRPEANLSTPEALMATFTSRLNGSDLDGLLLLYEPDAVFEPRPGVVVHGHDQIRDALAELLSLSPRLESEVMQVLETDAVALVVNAWRMTGQDPSGSPVEMSGRSADVVRRQPDGRWLVAVDKP
jgi:uncharacterized protein (TIGR02246 family)